MNTALQRLAIAIGPACGPAKARVEFKHITSFRKLTFQLPAARETVCRGGQSLPWQSPGVRPVAEHMAVASAQAPGGLADCGHVPFPHALPRGVVALGFG